MTGLDRSVSEDQPAEPKAPRFWLTDLRGYWRDEVLKDLVKYAAQVSAAAYLAILFGLIPDGDIRTRLALVLAAVLMVMASAAVLVLLFTTVGDPAYYVMAGVVVLAAILLIRVGSGAHWLQWAWLTTAGIGFGILLLRVVFLAWDETSSKGWRAGGRRLLSGLLPIILLMAAAYGGGVLIGRAFDL